MNYRHAFHAGNFADVFKHILLTRILAYLVRKPAPLFYLDTHAGTGLYDLTSEAAQRSPEWQGGIARVAGRTCPDELAPLLAPYLDAAIAGQRPEALTSYAGSPLIAQRLLRAEDRLVLCELHPEDAEEARIHLGRDRRVHIRHGDGYEALNALVPPKERRGLVLIDPPYEKPSEWHDLAAALNLALRKWPTGVYAVWYPIKDGREGEMLAAALDPARIQNLLCLEMCIAATNRAGKHDRKGLAGTGMLVINPPFPLADEARLILPDLARLLAPGHPEWRVDWLRQS